MTRVEIEPGLGDGTLVKGITERTAEGGGDWPPTTRISTAMPLGILVAPLALQEMVMAVWLIAKGFTPTAIPAESAGETSRWQPADPSTVPATWVGDPAARASRAVVDSYAVVACHGR